MRIEGAEEAGLVAWNIGGEALERFAGDGGRHVQRVIKGLGRSRWERQAPSAFQPYVGMIEVSCLLFVDAGRRAAKGVGAEQHR
jgi:hypothetical protein